MRVIYYLSLHEIQLGRWCVSINMKKLSKVLLSIILVFNILNTTALASDGGELGFFGGISEGSNLPRTIDKYVDSGIKEDNEFEYYEVLFISGEPIELKGTIKVTKEKIDLQTNSEGTYKEKYQISASNKEKEATIDKTIEFITSYRTVMGEFKKQMITSSIVTNWDETIEVGDKEYELLEKASSYSKSSNIDMTPGVDYYDTVISYNAKYLSNENKEIVIMADGSTYGYEQPWSKVETQNISMDIIADDWQMVVELKPFSEAKKTIYYTKTDPFPISFGGTYNQRLEREATLTYEILSTDLQLTDKQKKNSMLLTTANEVEKLPIPENLDFIEGHWAAEDLKQLYSMEILTEIPHQGMQYEAMPRGEFIKALCLAMDIDTSQYEIIDENSVQIFGDVPPEHPLYPYLMAAYDAKLIKGVGYNFNVNKPITRQEAFVINIRIIGLKGLEITDHPQTPFVDDGDIASWARKELMAGYKLGIIKGNNEGQVLPSKWISKSEAAAIINRLINYLRDEISRDYR